MQKPLSELGSGDVFVHGDLLLRVVSREHCVLGAYTTECLGYYLRDSLGGLGGFQLGQPSGTYIPDHVHQVTDVFHVQAISVEVTQ